MFCHGPNHERPKHRGQRGRHAVQRRQFLEQLESFPEWFTGLVQEVYSVQQKVLTEMKILLHSIEDSTLRARLVQEIAIEVTRIGVEAQEKRPDSQRARNSRFEPPVTMTVSDLDGRFKWLQGTIHLMVRKLWEVNPDDSREPELRRNVGEILNMVLTIQQRKLPERGQDSSSYLSSMWKAVQEAVSEEAMDWLIPWLSQLVNAPHTPSDAEAAQESFARLPSSAYAGDELKNILTHSDIKTLSGLSKALDDYAELLKDRLLGMEHLGLDDSV